jgi:hypothetical protein
MLVAKSILFPDGSSEIHRFPTVAILPLRRGKVNAIQ